MNENTKPLTLKLLGVIVDRTRTKKVTDILRGEHVRFHFITLGEGTAGTELMSLLGLNSIDKSLICCIEPDFIVKGLMAAISESLQLRKPGKGIAFIMPLSGVNSAALQLITKDVVRKGDEEKMEVVKSTSKYDMVLAVINQGHVNELMEAARGAGARGGTVLHGRKVGVEEEAKFLGISVQLEKDIVSILVNHEQKNDVMRAITQACGISTESQGVVIALPVDEIDGLGSVKVDLEAQQA